MPYRLRISVQRYGVKMLTDGGVAAVILMVIFWRASLESNELTITIKISFQSHSDKNHVAQRNSIHTSLVNVKALKVILELDCIS